MKSWIQTYTGKQFWPLAPRVEDIDIEDIAHALSNICRFTGHCRHFYSVAQHSVLVSRNVPRQMALSALLHDASEAYLADVAKPIKAHMGNYVAVEQALQQVICARFQLPWPEHAIVKEADTRMLLTEKRDLCDPEAAPWEIDGKPYDFTIVPQSPALAKVSFLAAFGHYQQQRAEAA